MGRQLLPLPFDRASGKLLRRIPGLPNVIGHLSFSPDGRYLAAALWGANGVRVYRTRDWQQVGADKDYGSDSYSADFDRGGRLVTTSYDGYLRLYDRSFKLIAKKRAPGGKQPFSHVSLPTATSGSGVYQVHGRERPLRQGFELPLRAGHIADRRGQ